MLQRLNSIRGWLREEDRAAGLPFFLFLTLVMAMIYGSTVRSIPSFLSTSKGILFTVLMLAHVLLHWFSLRVAEASYRAPRKLPLIGYLVVQAALIFALSWLGPEPAFVIALYAALAGETVGLVWASKRAVAAIAVSCVALVALNFAALGKFDQFLGNLPVVLGILAFSLIYVLLYIRQVQAREDAQLLLVQLEDAHRQLQAYSRQVEALSITQERQRMARELHDTLAQGLVGLILQLEAVDGHLDRGNSARAQAVVQQAAQRAKATLSEARRAIQALRPTILEQETLIDALGREVESFAVRTGVQATFEVGTGPVDVPSDKAQDILRIVQEALSNIDRHAGANHVRVRLARHDGGLQLEIEDDGAGFDVSKELHRPGCFGIVGMQERAERLGGVLRITSEQGTGTKVALELSGDEA